MIFRRIICITTAGLLALSVKGLSQTPIPEIAAESRCQRRLVATRFSTILPPKFAATGNARGDSSTGRIMTAIVELPVPEPVAGAAQPGIDTSGAIANSNPDSNSNPCGNANPQESDDHLR